jgi:hypothetical protein
MQQARQESGPGIFEVILYFENSSWLFSTSAYSSHSKAALEFAEREFSVHALHHSLGKLTARTACVMDQINNYYFAKRNGRWQIDTRQAGPKLSRNASVNLLQENYCHGSGGEAKSVSGISVAEHESPRKLSQMSHYFHRLSIRGLPGL